MVLVGLSIIPHGTMILDLSMIGLPVKSEKLHFACEKAAVEIAITNPETIILFTPHGISSSSKPSLYLNKFVKGSAGWNGFWDNYTACASCDQSMAL